MIEAAKFCERYGVQQVLTFDPKIGKEIYRLRRTDPDAPEYPELMGLDRFARRGEDGPEPLVGQHSSELDVEPYA